MWLGIGKSCFLAAGLWFAVSNAAGELYVNTGNAQSNVGDFAGAFISYLKAGGANRLSNPIREREATIYGIANAFPPDVILAVIDRILLDDPNNGLLYWYGAIQSLRGQDMARARVYLDRLKQIGPDWPETQNAEDVYAAVAAMVVK